DPARPEMYLASCLSRLLKAVAALSWNSILAFSIAGPAPLEESDSPASSFSFFTSGSLGSPSPYISSSSFSTFIARSASGDIPVAASSATGAAPPPPVSPESAEPIMGRRDAPAIIAMGAIRASMSGSTSGSGSVSSRRSAAGAGAGAAAAGVPVTGAGTPGTGRTGRPGSAIPGGGAAAAGAGADWAIGVAVGPDEVAGVAGPGGAAGSPGALGLP